MGKSLLQNFFSQSFPPKPTFTTDQIPDQTGRVIIVTGVSYCSYRYASDID